MEAHTAQRGALCPTADRLISLLFGGFCHVGAAIILQPIYSYLHGGVLSPTSCNVASSIRIQFKLYHLPLDFIVSTRNYFCFSVTKPLFAKCMLTLMKLF